MIELLLLILLTNVAAISLDKAFWLVFCAYCLRLASSKFLLTLSKGFVAYEMVSDVSDDLCWSTL